MVDMRVLPEYKNFWLLWLSAAGSARGQSLFAIQKSWGITSNYLYHNEHRIGKPLVQAMIDSGYLNKEKGRISARFAWIPSYVEETFVAADEQTHGIRKASAQSWQQIQPFIEQHHETLFGKEALQALYGFNPDAVRRTGFSIFHDLYLLVLHENVARFANKFQAPFIPRLTHALLAHAPRRDLLSYARTIRQALPENTVPRILPNEQALGQFLALSPR
ncbi:MAG: hypothetical protein KKA90_05085 [Nanoarchaeota archaeon]|nr:hypothetical protein [Nanoarchaeota archaeon]